MSFLRTEQVCFTQGFILASAVLVLGCDRSTLIIFVVSIVGGYILLACPLRALLFILLGIFIATIRVSHYEALQQSKVDEFKNLSESVAMYGGVVRSISPDRGNKVRVIAELVDFYMGPAEINRTRTSPIAYLKMGIFPRIEIDNYCLIRGEGILLDDPKSYLVKRGVHAEIKSPVITCSREDQKLGMVQNARRILLTLKSTITKQIESNLVEPYASLLIGILLGSDRKFSAEFEESIRVSGTSHIIAASGYNVSVIYSIFESALGYRVGRYWRNIVVGLSILCYAFISGMSASIVRATLMLLFTLAATQLGTRVSIYISLLYSIALFVFISPLVFFDIGFQLSIGAISGLIFVSPILNTLLDKVVPQGGQVSDLLKNLFLPTLSCTIFTIPISVYHFGAISFAGLISNLFVLPLVESTFMLGVLYLVIGTISADFASLFLGAVYWQLRIFEEVIIKFSDSMWLIEVPQINLLHAVIAYLFLSIFILLFYPPMEVDIKSSLLSYYNG